jgi:hypothetical protein
MKTVLENLAHLETGTVMLEDYTEKLSNFHFFRRHSQQFYGDFNKYDLMSTTRPDRKRPWVFNQGKNPLSGVECRQITNKDRFNFVYILAQNWLTAMYVRLHDSDYDFSQKTLFGKLKKKKSF